MPARNAEHFLEDYDGHSLPWPKPVGAPMAFETGRILFGHGDNALEVAIASATRPGQPKAEDLRALFKKRQANRPAPVLLVVTYAGPGDQPLAAVVGTIGDPAPVSGLGVDRVARICAAALAEPDRHAAARSAERLLAGLKDQLSPGLVNFGLFASHELRTGVPARPDWEAARTAALPLLGMNGLPLIHALGYQTAPRGSAALLLTHNGHSRAVAVLLDETEVFDRPSARFGAVSPMAHGLTVATREELPWLVVLRGSQIRLYPARPDIGVGRKGQAETYTELDLALLSEEEAAYLTLLFAPSALDPGGTAGQILAASENFAVGLGERLRERIYEDVVPGLALAIAARMRPQSDADLTEAYHRTLLVLFRLLFLAYAEDRGLLPYGRNPRYDRHAIKTLARDFADDPNLVFDVQATSLWDDMVTVWAAVDEGNAGWDVPAYNGGLFSRDSSSNPSGAALADLRLADAEFGPVLRALLVDMGEDGTQGPVDFRSLGVREFGTIYEGLLESDLSISESNLTVKEGSYLPAGPNDDVVVPEGQVYIHNKSGERKATGSYFTKQFAVEHLLDSALEPAITVHLDKIVVLLEHGDEAAAADAFFDFRLADLAMGSAHFLVSAIDRIEARFTVFLTDHPVPAVTAELTRLDQAARTALGEQAVNVEIETTALLRRQIARRCIYGLDLNLMAVELARLSVWIHTFVPGLPMSTLDHNLVVGNSLTGIGTVDEVLGVLEPGRTARQRSFFADEIESALASANDRLQRAARTAEATKAEVREAAKAHASAMNDAADAKALFDAAIGVRLKVIPLPVGPESAIVQGNGESVQAKVKALRAAHFPYFFPEVFLRHNPGFDVLIGNPPWEKIKVEEHIWWGAHFPGLRGLSQRDKNRAIVQYRTSRPDLEREFGYDYDVAKSMSAVIAAGPFPDIRKATDVDLFAAFCWRFWYLLREGGYSGIVLPRTALAGAAAVGWRKKVLSAGAIPDLTMLVNHREWVFADIHSQTTVGLITVTKSNLSPGVALRGPYADFSSYSKGMAAGTNEIAQLSPETVLAWSRTAAFPLLPASDLEVFAAMKAHPALGQTVGDWSFRPIRELHTTDNKEMFDFNLASPDPANTLPVWTGGSFNLWAPGSGEPYAYANLTEVVAFLNARRLRSARRAGTAFVGLAARDLANVDTLPMFAPRIAFRDVTNRENQRTLICALVPPGIALVEKAPYLLRQQGTERDEAYLLGILSSMPFDWYVRRYVERKMSYELLLTFPVPRVESQTGKCLAADGRLAGRDVDLRPARDRVTEIAALLGAVDGRYTAWAEAVGTGFNPVTAPDERFGLMCELDAVAALLFRLTRSQVEKLYETFSPSWDYRPRLAAVLAHYNRWAAALLGRENR